MRLIRVILTGLLILSSHLSLSANITPVEFNGVSASYKANTDFIELAPADSNGISYNKFSQFDTTGTDLKILNVNSAKPSDIIVFEAPNITLDAQLKLIGSRAEILFITQNTDATIHCNSCSFDSFTRITLASSKFDREYDTALSTLGTLNSSATGNVHLNNLDAPNALILDVIASNVSVDGLINLNQRVNKEVSGGMSVDKNGKYLLGGGSVNLNVGALNWDFDTRKVISSLTSVTTTPVAVTLEGNIQSAEVKILSTRSINLKTKIANQVDILASASYRGKVLVPSNSTTITTLPNSTSYSLYYTSASDSNITITNAINTDGEIKISSSGMVNVSNAGLSAANIEITAKNEIYNSTHLTADIFAASGHSIINRGYIESKTTASLWSSTIITNEFGGRMNAHEIILVSNSLIRNGSRTPYLTNHSSVNSRISNHKPVLNPSAIENGFYYITDHTVTDKTKAATTSAHIYAEKISIKTAAFENVNPYWVDVNYDDEFDLSPSATIRRDIVNGVSISAGKELIVEASEYVYNSSAILRMESEYGLLSIKGGLLNNDRYRQVNLLSKSYKEVQGILNAGYMFSPTTYTNTPTKTTELYTRSYVYSPPGRIYSAGEFFAGPRIVGTPSMVINNLGFIEIGKNAKITSTTIKQKGLKHHRIAHISEAETAPQATGSVVSLEGCIGCATSPVMEETGNIIEEDVVLSSRELDAFFSIGGKLFASNTAFDAENSSAFMEYVKAAIDYKIDSGNFTFDMSVPAPVQDYCVGLECLSASTLHTERNVIANNINEIKTALDSDLITDIDVDLVESTWNTSFMYSGPKTSTVVDEGSWSLFETINTYYEAIKQSILDAIQALKDQLGWWD